MTTLDVTCRRCGARFTPAPEDFRAGTWQICPAWRDRSEPRRLASWWERWWRSRHRPAPAFPELKEVRP